MQDSLTLSTEDLPSHSTTFHNISHYATLYNLPPSKEALRQPFSSQPCLLPHTNCPSFEASQARAGLGRLHHAHADVAKRGKMWCEPCLCQISYVISHVIVLLNALQPSLICIPLSSQNLWQKGRNNALKNHYHPLLRSLSLVTTPSLPESLPSTSLSAAPPRWSHRLRQPGPHVLAPKRSRGP